MNKILILLPGAEDYLPRIQEICKGRLEPILLPENVGQSEFVKVLDGAEAVMGTIPAEWLEGSDVRWLHVPTAGVNRFLNKPVMEKIMLTNTSGVFGVTIAEHSLAMLLALARRFPAYGRQAEQGLWRDCGSEWPVAGSRALILGTGDLGTMLAVRLKALGMHVVGICRTNNRLRAPFDEILCISSLDEELPKADAVFGCLPATAQTENLLCAERLQAMRQQSILINVGRGNLIDTDALMDLLEQGKFFGVGLDVTNPEPLPENHPLWRTDRVIITPHISGYGFGHLKETENDIWNLALDNLNRYVNGKPLHNLIDMKIGY